MADDLPIVGIPIKPFGVAKLRLRDRLNAAQRSRLGKAIAAHTIVSVANAGVEVIVVTADLGVVRWADGIGVGALREPSHARGLNGAAEALRDHAIAEGAPWMVLHADLPLVDSADVAALLDALTRRGAVIAPSHDGGTNAFGSDHTASFAYGPGSFHRHLRTVPQAAIVARPGLAFDLDTLADLDAIRDRAAWLEEVLPR